MASNKELNNEKENRNKINRGKPVFYLDVPHYIVYEFDDNIIISKNEDLTKSFCVKKSRVNYKLKKK
jgi:hypothetical protein